MYNTLESMDPQLLLFRRQYLQLFEPDFLAWPPAALLKDVGVQSWLFRNLFDFERNPRLPPQRYQVRVLKPLLSRIEKSIDDPGEDEISDSLMTHFSSLMASELPSQLAAAQQKSYVTFSCLEPRHLPQADSSASNHSTEPTITILERPNLISGSLTTGFRTWEASLHLATYLLSSREMRNAIAAKSILELGAGTGFLSILSAKILGAKHVTATDGDEGVVEALKENLFLNGLDESEAVNVSVLRWGYSLKGSWVQDDCVMWPYDVVIGADITYDKPSISALVGTLRMLFDMRPDLLVIIAGAVRNAETFETFRQACGRSKFRVEEVLFEAKPMREQRTLFYAAAVPFKIMSIRSPD
ncbi:hypothetical protein K431DRAFT_266542 [Polychaeton citri CBS 116435]|uniref:S-adenosyl-L-methionine-dependent methyltransferase n=1 Tax=Polychaeton citri CBS 116435 TaxID=1314669 RepID=A0A9P4URF2_9PEZI|nr:hypothetical protein K431DRAFT_266542 [Polychaeton citri CBS 116435]